MDSRERLDVFWNVIKLAAIKPEFEAKLRELIRIASEAARLTCSCESGP